MGMVGQARVAPTPVHRRRASLLRRLVAPEDGINPCTWCNAVRRLTCRCYVAIALALELPFCLVLHRRQGSPDSTDYRVFFELEGERVSPWHNIPLHAEDGSFNFVAEIPKDTSAKYEVATKETRTPIKQDVKKGKLRFYPYAINWNYGMLPQTWEDPAHKNADTGALVGGRCSGAGKDGVVGVSSPCPSGVLGRLMPCAMLRRFGVQPVQSSNEINTHSHTQSLLISVMRQRYSASLRSFRRCVCAPVLCVHSPVLWPLSWVGSPLLRCG